MVRKISASICAIALIMALSMPALGATHDVYKEGNPSTTYIQYFRDIVAGIGFKDHYVAFRSGQYSYTMCVGNLEYTNGIISLVGEGELYTFTQIGNYNSLYSLNYEEVSNFSVSVDNYIVYSDLGHFPQLVERGAQYEMLSAVLIVIGLLGIVINRIFRKR